MVIFGGESHCFDDVSPPPPDSEVESGSSDEESSDVCAEESVDEESSEVSSRLQAAKEVEMSRSKTGISRNFFIRQAYYPCHGPDKRSFQG
jgi:hypothetical protein